MMVLVTKTARRKAEVKGRGTQLLGRENTTLLKAIKRNLTNKGHKLRP